MRQGSTSQRLVLSGSIAPLNTSSIRMAVWHIEFMSFHFTPQATEASLKMPLRLMANLSFWAWAEVVRRP